MQVMKWSVMALAVTAGTAQLAMASAQSEAKGFIEDSDLQLFNRILAHQRDYKNEDDARTSEEVGLGTRVLFESGFTQGTVGFGVDAHTLTSTKLDTGRGRFGLGQFAESTNLNSKGVGEPEDNQTEAGAAVKARLSNSTLKYGSQFVASPVFSTDDARILPEVATGTYLSSTEIEGLELSAGRFTALSSQTQTGRDTKTQEDQTLKSINIYGISYSFTDNLSASFHASDVEDFWKKKYVNINYGVPLADDQSLNFDFNYYKSDDEGRALAGELQNKLWSLTSGYTLGAHTVTLGYQRSSGDTGYNYGIDGGGTVWVGNSIQISDFVGKDERSWQVRYDLDMETYGVPGLSFMTRYVTGDNIDTTAGVEGEENEWNFESKYVIQEGAAKDLSFRLRHAIYRANDAYNVDYDTPDMNDTRLIIEYPLDII